jgi:protein-S-isoprenylcysteine O-methyltransferase Ste14
MTAPSPAPSPRLPSLGPRGEGWVAAQVVILGLILVAGIFGRPWPAWATPWRWLAAGAIGLSGLCLALGAGARLGRQLTPLPAPVQGGALRDRGVYGLCRHPMYGGVLLLCLGWALASAPLALLPVALGAGFLDAKRRVEEGWLRGRFPGYEAYAQRVRRRFIPFVW